jgi:hypothetical protein
MDDGFGEFWETATKETYGGSNPLLILRKRRVL